MPHSSANATFRYPIAVQMLHLDAQSSANATFICPIAVQVKYLFLPLVEEYIKDQL